MTGSRLGGTSPPHRPIGADEGEIATLAKDPGIEKKALAELRTPAQAGAWPSTLLCGLQKDVDLHLAEFLRGARPSAAITKALQEAAADIELFTGVPIADEFSRVVSLSKSRSFKPVSAPRQLAAALYLAYLIERLNRQGKEPRVLELGAGPSIEAGKPQFQAPLASRMAGRLVNSGQLRADISAFDPALVPQLEQLFGVRAYNAKLELLPHASVSDLELLLVDQKQKPLLAHLIERKSSKFVEGLLHECFVNSITASNEESGALPQILSFPFAELKIIALKAYQESKFEGLATYEQFLAAYKKFGLFDRTERILERAEQPAPAIAHLVAGQLPFDILVLQLSDLSLNYVAPLVAGHVVHFPWCFEDSASYAAIITRTESI